jgi:CRP-like cAMP-binding protein
MEPYGIETYLSSHPLFEGVGGDALRQIAEQAVVDEHLPGSYLFRQHDDAHRFYVILHGRVAIEIIRADGEPEDLQLLGEGDVIGWSWLFAPYEWQWSGRAVEPTHTIALNAESLEHLCSHDRTLGADLMSRLERVMMPWPSHEPRQA